MKVLAISAHPDDETLGCGGTLLKHLASGDSIFWAIATRPTQPRWSLESIKRKETEVERVALAYVVEKCFKLGFPTVRLDTVPQDELIEALRRVIEEVGPETVYLVHGGDIHTDHRAVFSAAMSVLKPFYMHDLGVRRVLAYESLSSTEAAVPNFGQAFSPNVFSDITESLDRKLEIMEMYQSELQKGAMPRTRSAIQALARYRGATVGVDYAEAFMLIREVV